MSKEYLFYVYILSNKSRTVLYVGFTNNIVRRIMEHRTGLGSVFSAKYNLGYLIYYEKFGSVHQAIFREKEIKKWSRKKKYDLIENNNPKFKDLSVEIFDAYGITKEDIECYLEERKK
jgi:putative endonuclease